MKFRNGILSSLLALLLVFSTFTAPLTSRAQTSSGQGAVAPVRKTEFVPGNVLVRFRPGSEMLSAARGARRAHTALPSEDGREIAAQVEDFAGGEIVEGLRLVQVAPEETLDAVKALSARADVLYAEPDYIWHKASVPNDPSYTSQWGLKNTGQTGFNDFTGQQAAGLVGADIKAEQAWDLTKGSRSVVVAVIDEGIDITHPDLQPNIWTNPGEVAGNGVDDDGDGFVDDIHGWDFVHNDNSMFDDTAGVYPPPASYTGDVDDHGTHVAGTIGAVGNNGTTGNNGEGVVGVNWQVSLMSVKVLGVNGGSTSNIIAGYNFVKKMRDLWVNSGHTKGADVRVTNNSYGGAGFSQSAFNAIQSLNSSGILFVAAAGNDAQDNFSFPHYPSDYALPNVISVAATDRFEQLAIFSDFGARTVTLGAPGRGILSTTPFNTYNFFSGTSMATPHVAGVAALMLAANPNLSVQNLRGGLIYSGDVVASTQGQTVTGRRLNAFKAVQTALENDTGSPAAPMSIQVVAQSGRNVTIQWTAPGDDGVVGTASDYDFYFVSPSGKSLLLPTTVLPTAAFTTQTTTVTLPYRNFSGTVELHVFDNAGNTSVVSVPVSVGQNAGSDPYVMTESASEPLSTGGTALALNGDDVFKENVALPFTFPFFGVNRTSVNVSSNGVLYFSKVPNDGSGTGLDADSSSQGLNGQTMIAGIWDDLRTDRPGGDVFVVQPDANRVIYRWQAVTFDTPLVGGSTRGEQPVNFEIELRRDGTIIERFGAGQSAPTNTQLVPTVGIGGGEPDAYLVTSHSSDTTLRSLTNAQVVTFVPRAAQNQPPTVGLTSPTNGLVIAAPAQIKLTAAASDPDGSISSVEFFANGTSVGFGNSNGDGTFSFTWNATVANTYAVTAKATDNQGAATTSSAVSVTLSANPIDGSDFFVRQHYADFLNRTPDASGLAFWTNNIETCGGDAACRAVKRIDTSAAFFLSIEFQNTGFLVYRIHKAAFGNLAGKPVPVVRTVFLADTQTIGSTPAQVVVGQTGWEQQLETNKQAFTNAFVQRSQFTSLYPATMTAAQYVDALNANAGGALTTSERNQLVTDLSGGAKTRAQVLRAVAENTTFSHAEFDRAFVLMQYFGYLQRDPDAAPNTDFSGYNFWLTKLDSFGGDFHAAEMVKAFISSDEYRHRFGP